MKGTREKKKEPRDPPRLALRRAKRVPMDAAPRGSWGPAVVAVAVAVVAAVVRAKSLAIRRDRRRESRRALRPLEIRPDFPRAIPQAAGPRRVKAAVLRRCPVRPTRAHVGS